MNKEDLKGLFFKNLDECKKAIKYVWDIGLISLLILISLFIIKSFKVFYNNYLALTFTLIFIISVFLFGYSNFEYRIITRYSRRKIALEYGKCLRSNCYSNFGNCVDIYEGGTWICIYFNSELKKQIDEILEKINLKEEEILKTKLVDD